MQWVITILLIILIIQNYFMSEKLNEIKAELTAANEKLTAVEADVQRLHDIIAGSGDQPTEEEWAEVKTLAEGLKNRLTKLDEETPE